MDDVPLRQRREIWFLHDGAPAHFFIAVREHLNRTFGQRWIGRGGPVAWPPRSPDLNPLDFYLWGHLKSLVYAVPINTREQLLERIQAGCQQIRNNPGVFWRVRRSWMRRARSCVESNGGHIEHLL